MDSKKCRACYVDLESNDLYLKLDVIHKNSTLSLAEKLRKCVPAMDIDQRDDLYICMQCSMHLETAFAFHMTCLETETKFQTYNTRRRARNRLKKGHVEEEPKLLCESCNVHFSTKSIFDLHMKVMHGQEEIFLKPKVESHKVKKREKSDKPLFQMVFLQTNITSSQNDAEESRKNVKSAESPKQKKNLSLFTGLENMKRAPTQVRSRDGRFQRTTNKKRHEVKKTDISPLRKKIKVESNDSVKKTRAPKKESPNKKVDVINKEAEAEVETEKSQPRRLRHCPFCPKGFKTSDDLARHKTMSHKDKCMYCLICHRFYTNRKLHRKQYGCQLQNLPKPDSSDLEQIKHVVRSNEKLYYIVNSRSRHPMCLICRRHCPSIVELEKHIMTNHTEDLKCKLCYRSFSPIRYCCHIGQGCEKLVQQSHFNYTSDGDCICPICNKIFSDQLELKSHMARHLTHNLECKNCGIRFDKITLYCSHIVKGCSKRDAISDADVVSNGESVFIKTDQKCTVVLSPLQEEPLCKENTSSVDIHNRSVKIEPTELLDQSGFIPNEDSRTTDNDMSDLGMGEYVDANENDTGDVDSPELVYVMPRNPE